MKMYEIEEVTELFTWRNISIIYFIELCSEPVWANSYLQNSDILRK